MRTVQQAEAFLEAYEDLLTEEQRETIIGLAGTAKSTVGARILSLIKSGCWKPGLRKLGQIVVVVTAGKGR